MASIFGNNFVSNFVGIAHVSKFDEICWPGVRICPNSSKVVGRESKFCPIWSTWSAGRANCGPIWSKGSAGTANCGPIWPKLSAGRANMAQFGQSCRPGE